MRRYGEPKISTMCYTTRLGVYGVLRRGDFVLLTHQTMPIAEIQLPGGGVDKGEHFLQTLHREVLEETGWRVAIIGRLGVYQRYTFMEEYNLWARKVCHIYLCQPARRVSEPVEKTHSALWLHYKIALKQLANVGDADFVQKVFIPHHHRDTRLVSPKYHR